ncbi:helix-turn-helix domain-containing protein [Nocardia sp. NPDC019395]|uniref:helix-turn-helix domain-containing protein n=1 Tax=Nocardia sp. NPDC019395 TaxID=3154686 RepID=UPI0033CD7BA8
MSGRIAERGTGSRGYQLSTRWIVLARPNLRGSPAPESRPATAEPSEPELRIDAERNRERILAAARRLYTREGLAVPMAAVAREADVGKATLSRRFATREDLTLLRDEDPGRAQFAGQGRSSPRGVR